MIDLFYRLKELLGRRYNDPLFTLLINDLKEKPDGFDVSNPSHFNGPNVSFSFLKHGFFSIHFSHGIANRVTTLVNTPSTRDGCVLPFRAFPNSITAADSLKEIEAKLELSPIVSEESDDGYYAAYYSDPVVLVFRFDSDMKVSEFEFKFSPTQMAP